MILGALRGWDAFLNSVPRGFNHSAQGCDEGATLGSLPNKITTPTEISAKVFEQLEGQGDQKAMQPKRENQPTFFDLAVQQRGAANRVLETIVREVDFSQAKERVAAT
jgi:hypothetical protein